MNCQWNWPKPVFSCLHICLLYLLFLAWRQQSSNESFAGFLGARPMAKKTSWQAKAIWDLQGCLSGSTFPSSWDHSHRTPFSLAKDSAKKCQASDPQRCPKPVIHTGTRRVKRICLSGLRGIVVMWWCRNVMMPEPLWEGMATWVPRKRINQTEVSSQWLQTSTFMEIIVQWLNDMASSSTCGLPSSCILVVFTATGLAFASKWSKVMKWGQAEVEAGGKLHSKTLSKV